MESQNSLSCAKFTPTPNYWTYYCKCKWNISSLASFRISNYSQQSLFWLLCILFVVQVEMFERSVCVRVCVCGARWRDDRLRDLTPGSLALSPCPTVLMARGCHWKLFRRASTLGTGGLHLGLISHLHLSLAVPPHFCFSWMLCLGTAL